jgi:hypothetical protein
MVSQIQRGDEHLGSKAVEAGDPERGVTAYEFEQVAMLGALADYLDPNSRWRRYRRPQCNVPLIHRAFSWQSQRIRREIIPQGGVTQGGEIRTLRETFPDCQHDDEEVRVDVVNRGHNLRYER